MKWLIAGCTLIAILLAAGTVLTLGKSSEYSCVDCGMHREDIVFLGVRKSRLERRVRTDWYDRRIGLHHEHRWTKTSCTTGLNLWHSPTNYAYSESEPLASDYFYLASILNRLEQLNLDLEFHRDISHPDSRHRLAAAQAWLAFSPCCHDETLRSWWGKARTYLADRSLWNQSFPDWAYPPLRMTTWGGGY